MEDIKNTSLTTQTSTHGKSMSTIVHEIDNYYKKGALAYTEGLSRYKVEISKLKNKIKKLTDDKEKEEIALKNIEQELVVNTRFLERLQDEFIQKLNSIEELNNEYKNVVQEKEYKKLLTQKSKALYKVQDELEDLEVTQLNFELERINTLELLEPKRREIMRIVECSKELELEKEYFTSTKLHQLPLMGSVNTEVNLDNKEIVDANIIN